MLGKIEGGEEKGTTEDEMVGWHHRLNGHESEQSLGDSEGQGMFHVHLKRMYILLFGDGMIYVY